MRKFSSFMAAAVTMLAAVSCNKEINNIDPVTPDTDAVVYTAYVDGAETKTSLGAYDKVKDKTAAQWDANDQITIHNGTQGYTFTTTNSGSSAKFTTTEEGFAATKVMAVYPAGVYTADVEAKTVSDIIIPNKQTLVAGTYPATAAVAVAYSDNKTLEFKNATTLLKFKVAGDDVIRGSFYAVDGGDISGTFDVKYIDGLPTVTPTSATQWIDFELPEGAVLEKDTEYYIAVAPVTLAKGFAISLNGKEIKKYSNSYTLNRNVILDLGTLIYDAPAEPSTLNWGICGDMTGWAAGKDITMTLDGDWFVAENVVVAASQAFKLRAEGNWDVNRGAGGDVKPVNVTAGAEIDVYHNGQDMTVAPGTYNFYLSKDCNKFKVEAVGGYDTPEVTPGEDSEWAVYAQFGSESWTEVMMKTTTRMGLFVVENKTMEAYNKLLIKKYKDDKWTVKYGSDNVNYIKGNRYFTVALSGGDIFVEADGTYDIYFDSINNVVYLMSAGSDYKSAAEQVESGEAPVIETGTKLYLKPNNNWKADNARFAVYTWDGGDQWFDMIDSDSDGIYEVLIPEGISNIIFCRMTPNASANGWGNKWNQSSDLKVPTDGNNLYTVKDGTWDKGGGTWSVK